MIEFKPRYFVLPAIALTVLAMLHAPADGGRSGACAVHINGELQRSCSVPLSAVKASDKIVTIEGLSANSSHPVQKAWAAVDVPQCGYCQSGQIMAAAALLKKKPKPTDTDIDAAMTNICRCGTYQRIREAVHMAAGTSRAADRASRRS